MIPTEFEKINIQDYIHSIWWYSPYLSFDTIPNFVLKYRQMQILTVILESMMRSILLLLLLFIPNVLP